MAIPITISQYSILSQSILLPNKTNFFFQQRVSHKLLIFLMSLFLGPTQWPSISAVFIFLRVKKIKVSGENLVFYLAHFFSLFTSLREGEIFEFCQKSSIVEYAPSGEMFNLRSISFLFSSCFDLYLQGFYDD